jgi:tetratricopeptide (TPR) repeat protein
MLEDNQIDPPLRYAEEEIRWYRKANSFKYNDSADTKKYIAAAQKQQTDFKDTLPKYYLPYMQSSWEDKTKSDSTKLRYANKAFTKGEYLDAIDFYKEAYTSFGDSFNKQSKLIKARVLFQIAECYRMLGDASQEVQWYRKVLKTNSTDSAAAAKYLDAAEKQLSGNTGINK